MGVGARGEQMGFSPGAAARHSLSAAVHSHLSIETHSFFAFFELSLRD